MPVVNTYTFISIVITFTAIVSYINRRVLKLHPTIGALAAGFIIAIPFYFLSNWSPELNERMKNAMIRLDFKDFLLEFFLGFMLFAGSLHVNMGDLKNRGIPIGVFAVMGVVMSAFIIAGIMYYASRLFGFGLNFVHCLLFGALISPTDPIAVLAIMQKVGAPKDLVTDVCGESLFNDGVGVVMFLTVLKYFTGANVTVPDVVLMFAVEAVGGVFLGYVLGRIGNMVLASVDDSRVHILTTLAIASGGFTLANSIGASGAIAMVVAGLVIGNKENLLSKDSRVLLDNFWDVVDEVGNTAIFALVGFHLIILGWAISLAPIALLAGIIAIPAVLFGRFMSIALPILPLSRRFSFHNRAIRILTWSGLRGGLPLAMALAIPRDDKNMFCHLLTMTIIVVTFSILVQGLTIKRMIQNAMNTPESEKSLF